MNNQKYAETRTKGWVVDYGRLQNKVEERNVQQKEDDLAYFIIHKTCQWKDPPFMTSDGIQFVHENKG